jgi:hypothetical protein
MHRHCTALLALRRWLTPHLWKQARQAHRPHQPPPRWDLHPLLMVALLMTWTTGDSEAERFATARACYVAGHQRQKRPGRSLPGFHKALARLPRAVLHALCAAVRLPLLELYRRCCADNGFVVLACDGSRLECPRSGQLERRLGCCGKKDSAPMLQVTALVLLPLGVLWSWAVGPGTVGEHEQLRQLLATLPGAALLVADAGYLGYDLYADLLHARADFLVRLSSRAYLYTPGRQSRRDYRQGEVYYWPGEAQRAGRPPLRLRLIRVRGKKHDVWLLTSVLDPTRLSRRQAGELYRWRWQIEGVYRTYKRTLPKLKLWSRSEALVYREAEVSLLALQLVLLQGVRQRRGGTEVPAGPRQTLLRLRGDITVAIGTGLGPRQLRWYRARLEQVHAGGRGKKTRRKWPRRKDHKPPKPPKMRVLPKRLKTKLRKLFHAT